MVPLCPFVHLELSERGFKQVQFPSFVEVINRFVPPQDGGFLNVLPRSSSYAPMNQWP